MKIRPIFIACLLIVMLPCYAVPLQQNDQKNIPSEIMLTIGGDPTSEYSVTWRTSGSDSEAVAEIIKAVAHPKFGRDATAVRGSTATKYGQSKDRNTHKVRFTGLQPGTRYSYRVGNGKVWSEWFQFTTAKKEKEPFSFIYLGDVQTDIKSLGSRTLREAYTHLGHEASFMLFAGDLVTSSSDGLWSEFFYAGGWMLGSLPSVPVAGNHEYRNSPKGRVFSPHWSHLFGMPQNPPAKEYQDRFYWFDYQGVRFVGLDSPVMNKDNKDIHAILSWLEDALKENPNQWSVVFTHYPIYSCSSGRDNKAYRDLLRPILEKYGVDLVLQGHDHTYCRGFNEANITGDVKNPPLYVVTVAGPKMYKLKSDPWSDVTGQDRQLYQNITVDNDTIFYDSYDVTGTLFDSFRLEKGANGVNRLIERKKLD